MLDAKGIFYWTHENRLDLIQINAFTVNKVCIIRTLKFFLTRLMIL